MKHRPATTATIVLSSACLLVLWLGSGSTFADDDKLSQRVRQLDLDGDGLLQPTEAPFGAHFFARGDTNKDGVLSIEEVRAFVPVLEAAKQVAGKNKLAELKRRFEKVDKNGDGVVTREEFPAPDMLFERFDRDGNGKVVYDEAMAYAVEEEIAKASAEYDADLSGTLSAEEFPEKQRAVMRAADVDGDGQLTGDEAFSFIYNARTDERLTKELSRKGQASQGGSQAAAGGENKLGVIGVLLYGFDGYDADKSGKIDRAEFPASTQLFARLDVDGDRAVSRPELNLRVEAAKVMGERGKRLGVAAKELGMEQELAAAGAEVKAVFESGDYELARRLIDQIELRIEAKRASK